MTNPLDLVSSDFEVSAGRPLPLGVSTTQRGRNFSVCSTRATEVTIVFYAPGENEKMLELPLDPVWNRTGHVWHIAIEGLHTSIRYGWRISREAEKSDHLDRFDPSLVLVDPYARALTGGSLWGDLTDRDEEHHRAKRRSICLSGEFDWQHVRPPSIPLQDKVIYEVNVRGFTRDASSGVDAPGTYAGFIEKIPHLKDLGVTTVELLPIYDFDENELNRFNPETGEFLRNLWGYSPICFFSPKAGYALNGRNGGQVDEVKTLVRELHRAGIEVFLDVVFNHTAEGEGLPTDATYSFRGIDNRLYYLLDPATGEYLDYSGCGNTLNCNHPVVREHVLDALRYWVSEMLVDGFRFDLASILGRGRSGEVLANPPLLERIAVDPVLADVTVIAEAWDAAGLYQVGSFPSWGRWAEWNGAYRDDVRRFVRGDAGQTGKLASRLSGSSDIYAASGRSPVHSINFVTAHDGFTLADLVSYNEKHNLANGENNTDGSNDNCSWNCGVEGPTDDLEVQRLRERQMRNLITILFFSQGVPMLLGGDEFGRTQRGNNNAYCQDNEVSWFDWSLAGSNAPLLRFVRGVIAFRRAHPVLRRTSFLTGENGKHSRPDVMWHGERLGSPDWSDGARTLAMHLAGEHASSPDCDVYMAFNSSGDEAFFELPEPAAGQKWLSLIDTAADPPGDIAEEGNRMVIPDSWLRLEPRSTRVLRSG